MIQNYRPNSCTRLLPILFSCALSLLLFVGGAAIPPAAAQTPSPADAIELEVAPAFEGNYLPGRWLPLRVTLRNSGPLRTVEISARQPTVIEEYSLELELAAAETRTETLYVYMETRSRALQISLSDLSAIAAQPETGEAADTEIAAPILVSQQIDVRPRPEERLLALVSGEPLALNLPRRQDLDRFPFTDFPLPFAELPDHPAGYSSLTLLLLHNPPAIQLNSVQQQALLGWVANGGHLIIGGGVPNERTLPLLPAELLPATFGATVELDTTPLATYTATEPDAADLPPTITGVQLLPAPDAVFYGSSDQPLWVQRGYGNGLVTQLAFSPELEVWRTWAATPLFWDRLLQPPLQIRAASGTVNTYDPLQEAALASAVTRLPASNLPDSGPLFWLLVGYGLLVGPGITLGLRRLDRQQWAWLVVPAVAGLFLVLSLGLAFATQPDRRVTSQVSLIEQINNDQARARAVRVAISPRAEQYAATVSPDALRRPFRASTPQGSLQPFTGTYTQQIETFQPGVEPWLLNGLLAEAQLTQPAPNAQFLIDAEGITVQITNPSEMTLRNSVLTYRGAVLPVGNLAPGAELQLDWNDATQSDPLAAPVVSQLQIGLAGLLATDHPDPTADTAAVYSDLVGAVLVQPNQWLDTRPLLLAALDSSPLPVTLDLPNAAARQTILFTSRPTLAASGEIAVPPLWWALGTRTGSICSLGSLGGLLPNTNPYTLPLELPRELRPLQATSLSLNFVSQPLLPDDVTLTIELYNTQEQRWDAVGTITNLAVALFVNQPAAYIERGQLLARLSSSDESILPGCNRLVPTVVGRMP